MNILRKTKTTLLLSCLAISLLAMSSGCRSGGFTKPELSKLKFWESDKLLFASKKSETPPPPARHFDPAPINGEQKSEIVDLNNEKLQRRFKNDIEDMRAEISAATKALDTPIRKPYSTGLTEGKNEFAANSGSSFEAETGNVRSKLAGAGRSAKAELSAAQNDFQAAMNNTTDSFSNEFASAKDSAAETTQGWKDKFELPAIAQEKNKIDGSLAAVNRSLYDTEDRLSVEAESKAEEAFKSGIGAFGGSLKPLNNAVKNSTPELESVQAQMAEARRQIAELKKQVAMAGQPAPLAPIAQRSTGSNSFGPSIPPGGSNSFEAATGTELTSPPVAQIAQRQMPGFDSQFAASSSSEVTPANRLRSNTMLGASFPSQASRQPVSTPGYPATSHDGFAPKSNDFGGNFSPINNAFQQEAITASGTQVDFQATDNHSMVVTTNNAIAQNANESASQIEDHFSEVDMPESILKGSGSYAPGSVQPLRSEK